MTTLYDRQSPIPAVETPRLRVVLLLDVLDGHQERFLAAYEQIRHQVADVPGHVSDQLCQSLGNSSQWLITSEWESAEPFLDWVESPAHIKMVEPLHGCVRDTHSLRFVIARETPEPGTRKPAAERTGRAQGASADPIPHPPLASAGVVRHALTFTVKPGSEPEVARILAGYRSPKARVDGTTQLLRTSLFMHGNRVVRAVEVAGDLGNALRHVASQPEVRAVEEAVNPYLEEARDLTDPSSARAFFARAALPAAHRVDPEPGLSGELTRRAFLHTVRPGCGAAAARLLAELDVRAAEDPAQPLAASTLFLSQDLLVRIVDLRGPHRETAAGPGLREAAGELARLLDLGPDGDLSTEEGVRRFLAACAMEPVTDRQAQDS
ncbi:quinol monooxygenase YgiN [Kitasatospora sp. MAP12-15]|uniref:SchA/CurD-like domain-containing protein n=1 Tax=unclassified Kitasatospora TaxID=2633591 RepID=UPI002474441E|nr:SchA/CurD-like domain-containing protein [Kitasatospora sp. MAP12-44]MDH6114997.1 quinol monooxygenase YgiN [Kitasatospora sp. MAP12-44]